MRAYFVKLCYIRNWPLQLFSQDHGLAFHSCYDLQFNVDFELSKLCQKSTERKSPKEYFFIFPFDD